MTKEVFLAFYPQFGAVPEVVITEYVDLSNLRFDDCLDSAEEARRLYIAHKLTLYAQSYMDAQTGTPTQAGMAMLAGVGVSAQALSKSVGGVSVSKSEGAGLASISGYGELKQTVYGLQLIDLLKIATAGVVYIP